jgi:hypothetical protein
MTKADLEARKGLDYTFNFQYLPAFKLTPKGDLTER